MSNQPLVSIILPVYNAVATIENAIASALQLTYSNKELIIIDGGSNDGSIEIIKSFNGRIAHFQTEKDTGVYDAINKGIAVSKGEWIYILGADDRFHSSGIIEKIFSGGNKHDKIIFGQVKNVGRLHPRIPELHKSRFDHAIRWRNTLHQQAVFYHRSLFQSFRFDTSLKVLADYDLHLKLYSEKIKWQEVDVVVAVCQAQGISKRFDRQLYAEELRMKKKRMGFLFWLISVPVVAGKYIFKKITSYMHF